MPTYTFKNKDGDIFDVVMSIHELDNYKKNNPTHVQRPVMLNAVSDAGIKNKVPDGFRSIMSNMKSKIPHNNL